ncbi:hypothetical protein [Rhizobium sp. RAF56]|uniref:hypothetical protein n=1 Tax=Rhizobium sp. RAF56 TaxID=3233062 RepID=UPI003F9D9B2C
MQSIEITRNTEALLSAAGCNPISAEGQNADLVLERCSDDQCIVRMTSPRARHWAASELCCSLRQCFAGTMRLDMMSTDRLLKQAHEQGLITEFVPAGLAISFFLRFGAPVA